jgi:hypothetical protein
VLACERQAERASSVTNILKRDLRNLKDQRCGCVCVLCTCERVTYV